LKGVLCILASAFGFALMAFFVRLCDDCGGFVSSFQKSFFRNAIALVLAAAAFLTERRRAGADGVRLPRGHEWLVLVARSVFGTAGVFATFYALSNIPIGEAMTLNKTAPFFTVFFSWILLGERMTLRQIGALVLAFGGALLVMKPDLSGVSLPAAAGLFAGMTAGLAYVCVHRLGKAGVDGPFIVLFFSAFSCLASLPFMVVDPAPMTGSQLLVLLGAGVGAAIGQFGITAAYRYAEPRRIAVYDYSNVIFTAALGFLFLGQSPDLVSAAGFLVILTAAFFSRP